MLLIKSNISCLIIIITTTCIHASIGVMERVEVCMYIYAMRPVVFFVLFVFILCGLCRQFLWIVHFLLSLRYSLNVYLLKKYIFFLNIACSCLSMRKVWRCQMCYQKQQIERKTRQYNGQKNQDTMTSKVWDDDVCFVSLTIHNKWDFIVLPHWSKSLHVDISLHTFPPLYASQSLL